MIKYAPLSHMVGTKAPLDGLSETFIWDTSPYWPKNQHFAWHRPMFLAAAGPVMPENRVFLPQMIALALESRHRVQAGSLNNFLGS